MNTTGLLLLRIAVFLTVSGLIAHTVRRVVFSWIFKKRPSQFEDEDL